MPYYKFNKIAVGNKYGRWTIQLQGPTVKTKYGTSYTTWNCTCECGVSRTVRQAHLVKGSSRSCGCLRREELSKPRVTSRVHTKFQLAAGLAARNEVWNAYKQSAKSRGIHWMLTPTQFDSLIQSNCFYCGIPPSVTRISSTNGSYTHNGIDRIDSANPYMPGNVVTACKHCNYAKLDRPQTEFIQWVRGVYLNLKRKGLYPQ